MNIEIKSRVQYSGADFGSLESGRDHFRAYTFYQLWKKNAISHFTEGVNKNVILHL